MYCSFISWCICKPAPSPTGVNGTCEMCAVSQIGPASVLLPGEHAAITGGDEGGALQVGWNAAETCSWFGWWTLAQSLVPLPARFKWV